MQVAFLKDSLLTSSAECKETAAAQKVAELEASPSSACSMERASEPVGWGVGFVTVRRSSTGSQTPTSSTKMFSD